MWFKYGAVHGPWGVTMRFGKKYYIDFFVENFLGVVLGHVSFFDIPTHSQVTTPESHPSPLSVTHQENLPEPVS